ncbi:hypothetical protein WJX72_009595 [[Myrmecia] bisecta]|uniref:Uncharacterized protein n=1 Tax=[Myrmecia] bisecta TaxID=41462 RepID=A0AAW1QSE8_9CHLO
MGRSRSAEIESILAKAGSSASELPSDMQEALARGALYAQDVKQWLAIASTPLLGWICQHIPAFRDRVLGNPRFLLVLAIEEALGVAAKMSAEVQSRGDDFWKEIHFVASDMALEVIGDFAIVWLLSPSRSFKPPSNNSAARWINGLPGHALQVGPFSPVQRLATIGYRGLQFFCVGFGSSILGHSLTKFMVDRSNEGAGAHKDDKQLAPVLDNSLGWGGFMALSSNSRYQLVNGFEERVLNNGVKSVVTFLLRFGNTFVGGAQWVWFARCVGLQ